MKIIYKAKIASKLTPIEKKEIEFIDKDGTKRKLPGHDQHAEGFITTDEGSFPVKVVDFIAEDSSAGGQHVFTGYRIEMEELPVPIEGVSGPLRATLLTDDLSDTVSSLWVTCRPASSQLDNQEKPVLHPVVSQIFGPVNNAIDENRVSFR